LFFPLQHETLPANGMKIATMSLREV